MTPVRLLRLIVMHECPPLSAPSLPREPSVDSLTNYSTYSNILYGNRTGVLRAAAGGFRDNKYANKSVSLMVLIAHYFPLPSVVDWLEKRIGLIPRMAVVPK